MGTVDIDAYEPRAIDIFARWLRFAPRCRQREREITLPLLR